MKKWKAPESIPLEHTVDFWDRLIASLEELEEHVNEVLLQAQPRSQGREQGEERDSFCIDPGRRTDEWKRASVRMKGGDHCGTRIGMNTDGDIVANGEVRRVEAGSGDERCGLGRDLWLGTGRAFPDRVRCIFRAGHDGPCAFSVEG